MKPCILVHFHELSLKKDNRPWFEKKFLTNIRHHLKSLPFSSVETNASRVFIFGVDITLWEEYAKELKCVMGLKNALLTHRAESTMQNIKDLSKKVMSEIEFNSFRITTKRQDKSFKYTSQDINVIIGEYIQSLCKKDVSLNHAELNIIIEVVRGKVYIGYKKINGYGGLPNGTSESAVSLLSSGIDSPVASFLMLKRGVKIYYVHFHSAPATNRQSIQNCKKLVDTLSKFQLESELYMISILPIQKNIMSEIKDKYWVILFRRAMVKLACQLANELDIKALISGENVGQVSSQTISNIHAISSASTLPILRPIAGNNKEEIILTAKEIETYEYSIAPHQDCCSFFLPLHPELKANLKFIEKMEESLNNKELYETAMMKKEVYRT